MANHIVNIHTFNMKCNKGRKKYEHDALQSSTQIHCNLFDYVVRAHTIHQHHMYVYSFY